MATSVKELNELTMGEQDSFKKETLSKLAKIMQTQSIFIEKIERLQIEVADLKQTVDANMDLMKSLSTGKPDTNAAKNKEVAQLAEATYNTAQLNARLIRAKQNGYVHSMQVLFANLAIIASLSNRLSSGKRAFRQVLVDNFFGWDKGFAPKAVDGKDSMQLSSIKVCVQRIIDAVEKYATNPELYAAKQGIANDRKTVGDQLDSIVRIDGGQHRYILNLVALFQHTSSPLTVLPYHKKYSRSVYFNNTFFGIAYAARLTPEDRANISMINIDSTVKMEVLDWTKLVRKN